MGDVIRIMLVLFIFSKRGLVPMFIYQTGLTSSWLDSLDPSWCSYSCPSLWVCLCMQCHVLGSSFDWPDKLGRENKKKVSLQLCIQLLMDESGTSLVHSNFEVRSHSSLLQDSNGQRWHVVRMVQKAMTNYWRCTSLVKEQIVKLIMSMI